MINPELIRQGDTITGIYAGIHFVGTVYRITRNWIEILPSIPLDIPGSSVTRCYFGLYTTDNRPEFKITGYGSGSTWLMSRELNAAAYDLPHWIAILQDERDRAEDELLALWDLECQVTIGARQMIERLEPRLFDLISSYTRIIRHLQERAALEGRSSEVRV